MMNGIYIVTGALGYLGSTIVHDLVLMGKKVRGFDLKNVRHNNLKDKIDMVYGDITNYDDVERLLNVREKNIYVIHCAAIVSISSFPNKKLSKVNVDGVKNIIDCSIKHKVKKFVHVSSVHAIPPGEKGTVIKEITHFNPKLVIGPYAKTKAEASQYVLESVKRGLDATIVHPSGLIGPNDFGNSNMTRLFIDYINGKLSAVVDGGYDFVDVRDVSKAIIQALFKGQKGKCYILSNQYFPVKELLNIAAKVAKKEKVKKIMPYWFAKSMAFFAEIYYMIRKTPPLFTSYSLYTLNSNALFSHKLATKELGFQPRAIEDTIKDMVLFIKENNLK